MTPPKYFEKTVFGYHESVADSLWIRVIQDFDYRKSSDKNKIEKLGWVYHMLDSITELVPKLRIVYPTGGMSLSILVEDIEGASRIFKKGIKNFPNDWSIAYRASYHFIFEDYQPELASKLLKVASENGGPSWLINLSKKLSTIEGQIVLAESMVDMHIKEKHDKKIIEKMEKRLDRLFALQRQQYKNKKHAQEKEKQNRSISSEVSEK